MDQSGGSAPRSLVHILTSGLRTRWRALLLLLLAALLGSTAALAQERRYNIVFIPKSSDQVFWDLMRSGVDKAVAEEPQISLTWRGPAYNDDTDSQIRILQLYTRPGIDAIILTPTDRTRLLDPVKKVVALGTKVIVVDSSLDGDYHLNDITTDNYASGRMAARQLATLLNQRGKVLLFRTVAGSASTDDRARGFLDQLKEQSPQIKVLADVYGGGSAGKSRSSAAELLRQHPDADGIFAVNESSTEGMLRALRDAGLAGKPRFIGFDSTPLLLEGIDKQEIHGLLIQNPARMGYLSIKAALAAIHNAPISPRLIHTEAVLVTRDNYKQPDIVKLMCVRC
ncbi:MAG: hypothetical protein RJA44_261 [Pseudomonadota bacterium]